MTETRTWLDRLWFSIGLGGRGPAAAAPLPLAQTLAQALLSRRGEASGAAIATELLTAWRALDGQGRLDFARFLSQGFRPDAAQLTAAFEAWRADPSPTTEERLARLAEPPRQELLRRMNLAPGATASLIDLRQSLFSQLKNEPALLPLESDLRHLLASWFNRGFLELRRIDWQTPAATLEKLIAYEAVHEIQGWDDLRRRLDADRRCFAFFHPALPGEPLIFVEVALVKGLAAAVQPLLDRAGTERTPKDADTAIFYSISNCQEGLRGISFGNFLIKQVVEELRAELPQLSRFATLSPVPGFRRWLERDAPEAVPQDDWRNDAAQAEAMRPRLLHHCARFLTQSQDGRGPADPVARFHLGNGARLERINWLANTAPRGLRESFGVMVNYQYDLAFIEANHEAFANDGTVARSRTVEALLTPPPEPDEARPGLAARLVRSVTG
jgi:malonyl-CoA decarboxylase